MYLLPKLTTNPSKPVESWDQIKSAAKELIEFFDENNGKFKGEHSTGIALSHCQMAEDAYKFFVLSKEAAEGWKLPRVIVNAKILKSGTDMFLPEEGCMSFPFKKAKHVKRARKVTVEYQFPDGLLIKKLKTEIAEVNGLLAEVFQHEVQHSRGENIYY